MFRCSIRCHIESEKRIRSCSSVESRALRTGNLEGVAGRDVTIKMHFYSCILRVFVLRQTYCPGTKDLVTGNIHRYSFFFLFFFRKKKRIISINLVRKVVSRWPLWRSKVKSEKKVYFKGLGSQFNVRVQISKLGVKGQRSSHNKVRSDGSYTSEVRSLRDWGQGSKA